MGQNIIMIVMIFSFYRNMFRISSTIERHPQTLHKEWRMRIKPYEAELNPSLISKPFM